MRRAEIIATVEQVQRALNNADILQALLGPRQDAVAALEKFMTAFHKFTNALSPRDENVERLIKIFDLEPLLSAKWWVRLVAGSPDSKGSGVAAEMAQNVSFVTKKLAEITILLKQDLDLSEALPVQSRLSLIIPEKEGQTSTPERIVAAIDSIALIYRALCKLQNEKETTLALQACDSGSDKSFDFTGVPQIIKETKEVIFGIIDRVMFFKEKKYTERVKSVSETIPVITHINELVESKKLSPEQGEILRRELMLGATKFQETGSTIPEAQDLSRYNPLPLLQPAPTLLLSGPVESKKDELSSRGNKGTRKRRTPRSNASAKYDPPEDMESSLTEDEQKQLSELIAKMKKK